MAQEDQQRRLAGEVGERNLAAVRVEHAEIGWEGVAWREHHGFLRIVAPTFPAPAPNAMSLPSRLGSPRTRLLAIGVLVAGGSAAALVLGGPSQGDIQATVDDAGPLAPLAFVALYAVLTVLLVPGAFVTAAAGALFGTVLGTLLAVVGATLGAIAAFFIARRLGREQVEQIAGRRIGAVDGWLRRRGLLAVLYLRLIPLVPFSALNYAAGVTAVRPRDYVLGTVVGIVPGAFAYAALGGSLSDPTSPQFVAAVALVVVLAVGAPLVDRLLRRRETDPAGD